MIYFQQPENFHPKFEVVSCFIEYEDEILLLHRQKHKPQGDTWGLPAGKIDEGETPEGAMVREIKEEISLSVRQKDIKFFRKLYVRYQTYDFIYHMFSLSLPEEPSIHITPSEHQEFRWVSPREALDMPLIQDEDACIKPFYDITT